jgi:hypothetical protein
LFTAHAAADVVVSGTSLHRETDGTGSNSGDAHKQYVDLRISIAPLVATNPTDATHTFTVTVEQDDGLPAGDPNGDNATGFGPANNAPVTTSIANSNGATASMVGPGATCGNTSGLTGSGNTNTFGQCTILIKSPTAGVTTANASVTFTIHGKFNDVQVTRDTNPATANIGHGPGGSGPASKLWIKTFVRDASGNDITGKTDVAPGTVVHDEFTTGTTDPGPPPVPPPGGTVDFTLYGDLTCGNNGGAVLATDPGKTVTNGLASSVTFTTPAAGGTFSYLASYNGDPNGTIPYPAQKATCEPFTVKPVVLKNCPGLAASSFSSPQDPIFGGFTILSGDTIEDPASLIVGNMHSNNTINFSGNSVVIGNVEAVHGFNGTPKQVTGTMNGHAAFFAIPTLAQVLATVTSPPDLTITGNVNVTSANAASFFNKVVFVKGNVHIGATVKATFIATGNVDMAASTKLTAADGGHGLAAYGQNVNMSGEIAGGVVSPNINIATGTCN